MKKYTLPITNTASGLGEAQQQPSVVHIANGLNIKRPNDRSIIVALDLSKAFDMVSHDKLLDDVFNTTLPNQFKRWLLV